MEQQDQKLIGHIGYFQSVYLISDAACSFLMDIAEPGGYLHVFNDEVEQHAGEVHQIITENFLAGNEGKLRNILKLLELTYRGTEDPLSSDPEPPLGYSFKGAKIPLEDVKSMWAIKHFHHKGLIDHIKRLLPQPEPTATEPKLKWSPTHGDEVKLVRLVNVLHEMKLLYNFDGSSRVTKKEAMQAFGIFFGLDLTNFSQKLSNDATMTEEKYLEFFEEMKSKAQEVRNRKLDNQTKR
jgi:hypothetical protein